LNSEADRAEILAALECVDYVSIFPEMRATAFLAMAQPAIYVKGGDYQPETLDPEERRVLEEMAAEIRIIPFEAGYSTSGLICRMSCD
jgi:glycerol-3-phosphate cytidylyltransferase